jgi:flagellar P-ring protein precursor FlgI
MRVTLSPLLAGALALLLAASAPVAAQQVAGVRLKDVARVAGVRDNPLTGYGLVVGLAGTGDSQRSEATKQSIANTLQRFGVNIGAEDLASRNVAAVMVTGTLNAFAEPGQVIDVQVASLGDARSLSGGTLIVTPLYGPDERLYALAQGAISVGGYQFEAPGQLEQRNHPTAGRVPNGATIERAAPLLASGPDGGLDVLLGEPDFTSAARIAEAVRRELGVDARVVHAGKVRVAAGDVPESGAMELIARLENTVVVPDGLARVVINERTGTIVAGGDVRLGAVSVSHGNLRVEIRTEYEVSQPNGLLIEPGPGVRTAVVPQPQLRVEEDAPRSVGVPAGATVDELVDALYGVRLSTRDVITILQSVKAAGALHGELVIQ